MFYALALYLNGAAVPVRGGTCTPHAIPHPQGWHASDLVWCCLAHGGTSCWLHGHMNFSLGRSTLLVLSPCDPALFPHTPHSHYARPPAVERSPVEILQCTMGQWAAGIALAAGTVLHVGSIGAWQGERCSGAGPPKHQDPPSLFPTFIFSCESLGSISCPRALVFHL